MSFSPIMVASIPPTGFPPLRDLNTQRARPWSRQQLSAPLLGGPHPGSTTRSAGLRLRETERVRESLSSGSRGGPEIVTSPGSPLTELDSIRGIRAPLVLRVTPPRTRSPHTEERPSPRQDRAPGRDPAEGEGRAGGSPTAGRGLPRKLDGLRPGSPSGRFPEGTCTAALSPHTCPDPAAPF